MSQEFQMSIDTFQRYKATRNIHSRYLLCNHRDNTNKEIKPQVNAPNQNLAFFCSSQDTEEPFKQSRNDPKEIECRA